MQCDGAQGSVLGPLVFLFYVDLPLCPENSSILFADDTSCPISNKISPHFTLTNSDLQIIHDWFKGNKLSLNVNKSNYLLFTNKKKQPDESNQY